MLKNLKTDLRKQASTGKAKVLQGFFKTGPGEYGEGDQFLGVVVPSIRKISKKYRDLSFKELEALIQSKWHEERLLALFILVLQYQSTDDPKLQKQIYQFYVKFYQFINNWDLVDLTAPPIVGRYLFDKDTAILMKWTKSKNLWRRRVAILATFYFIKNNQFSETLKISKELLHDKENLIHKAVGWMLREVGKRDLNTEEKFLKKYYKIMPRTMLRYAIERFPEKKRLDYLKGEI